MQLCVCVCVCLCVYLYNTHREGDVSFDNCWSQQTHCAMYSWIIEIKIYHSYFRIPVFRLIRLASEAIFFCCCI